MVAPRASTAPIPDGVLLAVLQRPAGPHFFFFAKYGRTKLRMAGGGADTGNLGASKAAAGHWGTGVKLDISKGIVGLAASPVPSDAHLAVLTADGVLRGYSFAPSGMTPLYAAALDAPAPGSKGLPPPGVLDFAPHPYLPNAALLLYGARGGGTIMAFEIVGGSEPRGLIKGAANRGLPLVGLAFDGVSARLLAFSRDDGVGSSGGGGLRLQAWRAVTAPGSNGAVQLVQVGAAAAYRPDFTPASAPILHFWHANNWHSYGASTVYLSEAVVSSTSCFTGGMG